MTRTETRKKAPIKDLFNSLAVSALSLALACGTVASADTPTAEQMIEGSLETTAQDGYSRNEMLQKHALTNPDRWDIGLDETQRFIHLNTPQFKTHAWVHRAGEISHLEEALRPEIADVEAVTVAGETTLQNWLENGPVDGYLVIHASKVVYEAYPRMRPFDKHHWWSTSKSVTGTLVAMLEDEGLVDVSKPVETYIPRLKDTDWEGIPVVDVLDMATGTAALEADDPDAYTSDTALYNLYETSLGLRNPVAMTPESTYEFVASLPTQKPSGEVFEYTSVDTFVASWLVEEVTGQPLAEVISERIWQKMGAESDALIMTSEFGATHNSSMNSTLRDLGRYGTLFTPSWNTVADEQIISDAYLETIQSGGRPELTENAKKNFDEVFDGEKPVHNVYQWDLVMEDGDFFKGGHTGQGLYISPSRDTVVAFFGTGDGAGIAVGAALAREIAKSLD